MIAYKESFENLSTELNSSPSKGLSESAYAERFSKEGPNAIHKTNKRNLGIIFLEQFTNLLVLLLIGAAGLSLYLGSYRDAIVLFTIVLANALIGFYQNWKSENILSSISSLLVEKCIVIRDGIRKEIPVNLLIKGDLVSLSEGNGVPADIRLVNSVSLFTNDFILTGESLPKEKNASAVYSEDIAVADRDNCIYMGTTLAKGEALGLVYATGMETELGKIAGASMNIKQDSSPLQKEIDKLALKITFFSITIGVVLFAFRQWQNESITASLIFAISIAAAMVPEGLPAQISVALSLGVERLAKRKAVVKNLSSVETLGSATVIATDKTGTITKNEMSITFCHFDGHNYKITGTGFEPKGEILDLDSNALNKDNLGDKKIQFLSGYLASTAKINPPDDFHQSWYAIGDPTEAAFATLALKAGFNLEEIDQDYTVVQLLPFDSVRKRISIIRKHKEKYFSCVKGSIESVLNVSTSISHQGKVIPLDESDRNHLLDLAKTYAANGLRIIAIAYKDLTQIKDQYTTEEIESDLIFSGFVAMMDPPNEAVKGAIAEAFQAQLRVFMITGDNEITATAIAEQIGMNNADGSLPEVINDKMLQSISDEDLIIKLAQRSLIFSRVSPEEKLRIVTQLKDRGDIVAVTGDGVNDTLSLKKADIGVAMGLKGSKIAQEAANVVLLDDNFSTIVFAIEEGRTIYNNIQKNVRATLASNFAELTCVLFGLVAVYFNQPIAILAIHILLVDLIGEMLPLLALSFDPAEQNLMRSKPRKQGQMVNNEVIQSILFSGISRGLIALWAFWEVYTINQGDALQHEKAVTATFISIILTQFINIVSMRSADFVFNKYLFSNLYLFVGMLASLAIMFTIVYLPFLNSYLYTGPLSMNDWTYIIAGMFLYLTLYESSKWIKRRRKKGIPL